MEVVAHMDLTDAQFRVITTATQRFNAGNDFRLVDSSVGELPDGWVLCVLGEVKGWPRSFGVSPDGVVVVDSSTRS
jgi:hypothetical protein